MKFTHLLLTNNQIFVNQNAASRSFLFCYHMLYHKTVPKPQAIHHTTNHQISSTIQLCLAEIYGLI